MRVLLRVVPVGDGWDAGSVGAERRAGMSYKEWIPNRLKALRKQHGITLKTLSALTGLSIGYLGDIEAGRTVPTLQTLDALLNAYGLTLILSFKVNDEGLE